MVHDPILQMLSLSTPDPYKVYKEILYKISYAYSEPLTKFYISNTLAITVNKASRNQDGRKNFSQTQGQLLD